jgi:hypothetical protein
MVAQPLKEQEFELLREATDTMTVAELVEFCGKTLAVATSAQMLLRERSLPAWNKFADEVEAL